MIAVGLLATIEAKSDKVNEVTDMLKGALELAQAEEQTITWYAFKISATTFGIFDTFESQDGRQAHLNGPIAAALMAHADEYLAAPPKIEQVEILAAK